MSHNHSDWKISQGSNEVVHASGLTVEIERGEVVNIKNVPTSVNTRHLPKLLLEAEHIYKNHVTTSAKVGPRRPMLSLKKKDP